MTGLILAIALCGQARACVGPNCLPAVSTVAAVSPDTEVVQNVWITNENRWGVGVIRNGRFVAAVQRSPDADPDVGSLTGDTANYGLLMDGLQQQSKQGYMTNDKGFTPPTHGAPVAPPETSPGYPWLIPGMLGAIAVSVMLIALVILLAKGRHQ